MNNEFQRSETFGRRELLRLSLESWPSTLAGGSLMTLVVAAAFLAFIPSAAIWFWACSCLSVYGVQALLLKTRRRRWTSGDVPLPFVCANLLLGAAGGSLFGALTWIVPSDPPSLPLMAALACGMQLLGVARSPSSIAMLRAVGLPALSLVSTGLTWHAGLPLAGAVSIILMLMITRHGYQVRQGLIEAAEQRRQVLALSDKVLRQQAQLRRAEKEQAILNERQRLLRDMHDGVGASLVFALKLIEKGALTLEEAAAVMHECLDDLRLVIDSMESSDHDLATLVASLRCRLAGRFDRAGTTVEWSVGDVPELAWMNASQALEVLRIVQEALTNVLEHAGASRVRIGLGMSSTTVGDCGEIVRLSIEDNGIGFKQEVGTGRGLNNMRYRAELIGAKLSIDGSNGTMLRLDLPVHAHLTSEAGDGLRQI